MTSLRRSLPILLLAALAGAAGPAGAATAAAAAAAARTIEVPDLLGPAQFLAADLLEGRGPGSRGDALARLYLAAELAAAGFEPAGPAGSWEQRFTMVGLESTAPASWRFTAGERGVELARRQDFIAVSGLQAERAELADAELVFVGYGIAAPEHRWDDFKGADLRGKVLVVLNNDPDWDPELFAGTRRLYYGRWDYKYESAARQGAAGAIIVHTTPSAGYPWQVVQTSWSGEQFELPATGEPRLQVKGWVTEAAAGRLLAAAGHDLAALVEQARSREFRPLPLGLRTSLRLDVRSRQVESANVLGILPGRDAELGDEAVVYTAHHDHLGIGEPDAEGDRIYNGALDNASGCAQLLAIAHAFAALPERPRRSILIAFVAAEEQGLLGSEYYALHPTLPPGKLAAGINVDSANIYGRTADVTFIGLGKSSLDAVVARVAARQGRTVRGDPRPEQGSFYRSDQFSFARVGVPFFYLDPGIDFVGPQAAAARARQESYDETCYHQPCDEITAEWNLEGAVEDARLGFEVGLEIAEADELPAWNPGDEFEAARKQALAAARQEPGGPPPAAP